MKLSDEKFYNETLDLTIPKLKSSAEFFNAGEPERAAHEFAEFIKDDLNPELWLSQPISIAEGTAGYDIKTFADMIVDGYTVSVGYLHRYKDGIIDWMENPTFNKYCEFSYHICYHGVIQVLARAYLQTRDNKYAQRFMYIISSWLEQTECPEGTAFGGPLWRSLEAGGRMSGAWPEAIHSFLHCEAIPDSFWVTLFKSIWEHSYRLLSVRTIYNWHTTEMRGLSTMGLLYRCFKDSKMWLDHALSSLIEQIDTEFYPDGMQAELTTGYHGGLIYSFNIVADRLKLYGRKVPDAFNAGVNKLYSMYPSLCRPDLFTPGLNDGGQANVSKILAGAYERYPDNEVYRYFATARKEGHEPSFKSLVMPYSGFIIMRTDWSEDAIWAMLDGGPSGAQHIHEDKLNFNLYAYRTPMLADLGTYAYDTSDMRKYIISSFSHNTGIVDGKGQNRIKVNTYKLVDTKKVQDMYYKDSEQYEIAEATYDQCYGDDLMRADHNRKVIFFKKGFAGSLPFFVLCDSFRACDENEHEFELNFQLPDVTINAKASSVTAFYENGSTMQMVSDKYPKIYIGQYVPQYRGWNPIHSPTEHEHTPAPAVTYVKRGKTAEFATVLYPSPDRTSPEISVSLTENGFTLNFDGEQKEFSYGDFKAEHIAENAVATR